MLKNEGRWTLGMGNDISIVDDNWLTLGQKVELLQGARATKVRELINEDHEWSISLLKDNLAPPSAIEAVKNPIACTSTQDHLYWPHTTNGLYSIKSGYRKLLETSIIPAPQVSRSTPTPSTFWSFILSAKTLEKIKQFMWRVGHNALLVNYTLHKKKIS